MNRVTVEDGNLKIVDLVVTSWQPQKWAYRLSDMMLDPDGTSVRAIKIDKTEVEVGKVLYAWYEAYRDYREDQYATGVGYADGTTSFNAVIEFSEPVNFITEEDAEFNSDGGQWEGQHTGAVVCMDVDKEDCWVDNPGATIYTLTPTNARVVSLLSGNRLEAHVTQPNRYLRPVLLGQGEDAMLSRLIVEIPAWEPENLCADPNGEFCYEFDYTPAG